MKTLIWDIPTRLFHWGFAASITASFAIALGVDDDSPAFQLHMLFGLIAAFLLIFRIALGLFGSRHARFKNFPLKPTEVLHYFKGVLSGTAKIYSGNNPGSALAAVAMFALVPVIVLSGIGLGGEPLDDLHSFAAYSLLAVIGAHLLGIVIHTLRHRENIAATMITGKKNAPQQDGIRSARPIWGMLLAGAAAAWIVTLFANHDSNAATVQLPGTGTIIKLGENEGGKDEHREGKHSKGHHGENDDNDD